MIPVWPTIERFIAQHGAAALVTLAQAQGSSPREVGARMVVAPNGAFTGTIGGGALEWGALAEAQALLARRRRRCRGSTRRWGRTLGNAAAGACCSLSSGSARRIARQSCRSRRWSGRAG
jgi:xanthine dehydrogenase accessory factor